MNDFKDFEDIEQKETKKSNYRIATALVIGACAFAVCWEIYSLAFIVKKVKKLK